MSSPLVLPDYKRHTSPDDPMKIRKIRRLGRISSWLEVTVEKVDIRDSFRTGRRVYVFVFTNEMGDRIYAISDHYFGPAWNRRLLAGNKYAIKGNINVQKINPTYSELSTLSFQLFLNKRIKIQHIGRIFQPNSVGHVKQKMRNGQLYPCRLENVELMSGILRRYMGCEICTKSIRYPNQNGEYMCAKCPAESGPKQRKHYMMVYDLALRDTTGVLEDVIGFDELLITLLGKESKDFGDDGQAQDALEELFGATVNVDLRFRTVQNKLSIVCTTCTVVSTPIRERGPSPSTSSNIQHHSNRNIIAHDSNPPGPSESSSNQNYESPYVIPLSEFEVIVDRNVNALSRKRSPIIYDLPRNSIRLALVINNYDFPGREDRYREGSEIDVRRLKALLPQLEHEIFEGGSVDVKSSDLPSLISRFQEELIRREATSCIVVIMSHGTSNQIEMVDGKYINLYNDLVYKFSDDHFPRFGGRPKIFCVQACQGFINYEIETGHNNVSISDTLVIQSSLPGHYSYRNLDNGTPFIRCLVRVLMKMGFVDKLVEILGSVQMEMRSINPTQICTWQSFVFAEFYFFPPERPSESGPLGDQPGSSEMDMDAS